METQQVQVAECAITADALLDHWQSHRRLTRRTIEAFPEDQLFSFSLGGMRPFGELAQEMLGMGAPMVRGMVSGEWTPYAGDVASSREELLRAWDDSTDVITELWPQIAPGAFQQVITAFGQYEGRMYDLLMYVVDNEIHHRGQGYVYLRALGIKPPNFWERE